VPVAICSSPKSAIGTCLLRLCFIAAKEDFIEGITERSVDPGSDSDRGEGRFGKTGRAAHVQRLAECRGAPYVDYPHLLCSSNRQQFAAQALHGPVQERPPLCSGDARDAPCSILDGEILWLGGAAVRWAGIRYSI